MHIYKKMCNFAALIPYDSIVCNYRELICTINNYINTTIKDEVILLYFS